MAPPCYVLLRLCVYGLEQYGHLPLLFPVLFSFVVQNRKYVKLDVAAVFNEYD